MITNRFGLGFCLLVGAVAAGGLLVAADSPSAPATHEAVAFLQFRSAPGDDGAAAAALRKTQVGLLKSPIVLMAALRRPGIADLKTVRKQENSMEWLSGALDVVTPENSEVIQVRLRGDDPGEIAKILNAVTTAYLDDVVRLDRATRQSRQDALEKKYKELQADLRKQKEELLAIERTAAHRDELETGWLEGDLVGLRSEVASVRAALRAVEADIAVAAAAGEPADIKLDARRKVLGEQAVALVAEMEAVRGKLRELRKSAVDLAIRREEVERSQRVTDQLGMQLEKAYVELKMPASVRLLEEVVVPVGERK